MEDWSREMGDGRLKMDFRRSDQEMGDRRQETEVGGQETGDCVWSEGTLPPQLLNVRNS